MRKILLGLAATALVATPLVAATSANAAVERQCDTAVPVVTSTTVATFDAVQPAGAYHQWDTTWKHHYVVNVNPDGTFTGEGTQNGNDGYSQMTDVKETIVGTFTDGPDADLVSDQATYTATRADGVSYTLTQAWLGTGNIAIASVAVDGKTVETPDAVEFLVSMPSFEVVTVNGVADFANHGEYVDTMGGGKIAAQKCVGMPIKAKSGK